MLKVAQIQDKWQSVNSNPGLSDSVCFTSCQGKSAEGVPGPLLLSIVQHKMGNWAAKNLGEHRLLSLTLTQGPGHEGAVSVVRVDRT